MSFFDRLLHALFPKTRDSLYAHLQSFGINVQMAERGRAEEKIGSGSSNGLIDVLEGPIRWVDVREPPPPPI